jgi:NADH-quinone oxidoreductase subunit L
MISSLALWIVLLPALGALLNGVLGAALWRRSKTIVSAVACGAVFLSFLFSALCAAELAGLSPGERVLSENTDVHVATFIPGGFLQIADGRWAELEIAWKFRFDPLSALMALVITGVGLLIHIYSIGYMAHEKGFFRYFAYLNLFMAMMLTLVLSANFVTMFIGWEGVGLCSYLLIGFLHKEIWTTNAANKAFIVNRVGDLFMVMAVGLVLMSFGTLDFAEVNARAVEAHELGAPLAPWDKAFSPELLCSIAALLVFAAATAKSAQFPLYVWLPDAMAGPTPVSALIHAATMVTSGIYALVRLNGVFQVGQQCEYLPALTLVAVVGGATALFAASIGLAQNDIKKVLAYSTVSQLGYMFLAIGVGAFTAGMFHLMTHAFFKALLFLGAGSVIHALSGEQDLRRMGGLKESLPITHFTMLVGCLAIAGFPPFAGFFSKDEILFNAFAGPNASRALWFLGVATALMTSLYMFRLYYMTFHGAPRMSEDVRQRIHESPPVMWVPLVFLAAGATVAGFLGIPAAFAHHAHVVEAWLAPTLYEVHGVHGEPHASLLLELGLMAFSVAVAALGFFWARAWYRDGAFTAPRALAEKIGGFYTLVKRKYYIDEAYYLVFVDGVKWMSFRLWDVDKWLIDGFFVNGLGGIFTKIVAWLMHFFDLFAVDGLVNLWAWLTQRGSGQVRKLQTGFLQNYAFLFACGVLLLVALYWYIV